MASDTKPTWGRLHVTPFAAKTADLGVAPTRNLDGSNIGEVCQAAVQGEPHIERPVIDDVQHLCARDAVGLAGNARQASRIPSVGLGHFVSGKTHSHRENGSILADISLTGKGGAS